MKTIASSVLTRWIVLALVAANLMVAALIGFFVHESKQRYTDLAAVNAQNLTQVLEQQINASVRQVDISLRSISDTIRNSLVENKKLGELKLSGLLTQQHARLPDADQLYLINERGQIIANSNFDSGNTLDIARQSFFQTLRDDLFASLVVGHSTPYTNGPQNAPRYVIPFAHRINQLDGSFAGALVVLIEVDRFARSLTQVDVGSNSSVSLLDGKLNSLAKFAQNKIHLTHLTEAAGAAKPELGDYFPGEESRAGRPRVLSIAGGTVMVSLRQSPDWPFHISVSLDARDYLSQWQREVRFSVIGYLLFLITSSIVARVGYLAWRSHLKAQSDHLRLSRFNEALIRAIPIPVTFKDKNARYIGCNPAFSDALGFSESDLRGKTVDDLWPEDLANFYRQKDDELLSTNQSQVFESVIVDRQKNLHHVIFARNIYLDEHNQVAGIIGTFVDISERKKAEEEIENARIAAEDANLAKSRFLATMSHELRTPLNGVLGMAQLMLMTSNTEEETREYASVIKHSGEMLLTLLNDILDISKIEAGKFNLEIRDVDISQLIHEILALFAEVAAPKGLHLIAEIPSTLETTYRGDPTRLNQMLANLVNNAIKFSENGEIQIKVSEITRQEQQATLLFEVIDCGIGIPADKIDLLFRPFTQADSSTTRKFGGTGLGLSIVRNLAEMMNGKVGVDSRYGQGSRFWFEVQLEVPLTSDFGTTR